MLLWYEQHVRPQVVALMEAKFSHRIQEVEMPQSQVPPAPSSPTRGTDGTQGTAAQKCLCPGLIK